MSLTNGASLSGKARGGVWFLIGAACALQAYEIPNRGIDPDELEHLHAAFCVWHGEVPYRDFFEHHAPALYYLMWPLFAASGPHLSVLWGSRALMFGLSLAALWLTGRLAGRWGGKNCGLIAAALLAWTTVFQAKGIELRPDVPAMLLLLAAVAPFAYATGGGSWRRFLCIGFLCGLAMLFTQKSLVPVAGIALAACLSRLLTRAPGTESAVTVVARVVVPFVAGVTAVWGAASLLFASAGAAGDFWYSTWYQLWIWPIRSNRWDHLRPTLAGDLTVWVAAALQIVAVLRRCRGRETWEQQRGAAAVIAMVCLLSLPFVKATYPQFYLLWMPFLAALAAARIVSIFDGLADRSHMIAAIVIGAGLVLVESALWQRAYRAGTGGALPRLAEIDSANAVILLVMAAATCALAVAAWRRSWSSITIVICGIGMTYGILRNIDIALWSNRKQVAAMEGVLRQVAPDERVLDGFTGYAALRPHVWYYWWINEYSLALVPDDELETQLAHRLDANLPAAILFDENIAKLPTGIVDWIRRHYEPADPSPLWVRKWEQRR